MSCIARCLSVLLLVFLTSSDIAVTANQNSQPRQCSGGQEWRDCGSPCNSTCHQRNMVCAAVCVARCQCPPNRPVWHNHQCITRLQCPSIQGMATRPCRGGQVWTECGSCTKTCRNPNPPCIRGCVVRCECPPDRPIWSHHRCIRRDQCAAVQVPVGRQCHGGQVWNTCGSACTSTCLNPQPTCTSQCMPRCQCPPDKPIWSHHRCIRRDECASVQVPVGRQCHGGQVWNTCGRACTSTCQNTQRPCTRRCMARCQCPLDKPIWSHHRCIRRDECASATSHNCQGGQMWNECGSPCTRTCNSEGMICATVCVRKCQCPRARPVWSNHQCIRMDQCPSE